MQDAVANGTVTPLLYEERKPVIDINEAAKRHNRTPSWFGVDHISPQRSYALGQPVRATSICPNFCPKITLEALEQM